MDGDANIYHFLFLLQRAPVAVGKSFKSGEEMYMSAMKGKCLNILNIYTDNLWALGDKSIEMPLISSSISDKGSDVSNSDPKETSTEPNITHLADVNLNVNALDLNSSPKIPHKEIVSNTESDICKNSDKESTPHEIDHEKLVEESFLCAVKFKSKEFKLPIIVSTFMKIMQTCW